MAEMAQMENSSAYGGNPLPPSHLHPHHPHHPSTAAALVAFSQANSQALSEALRLSSRPFPQAGDGKSDLVGSSLPFSAAAAAAAASAAALSSLRGGGPAAAEAAAAAYHNLPLLHHLHQQNAFFGGHHGPHSHPHGPHGPGGVSVLSPFSTGAFRPLTPGEAFGLANPHAAALQVQNGGKGPSANGKEPLPFNLSRYNPLFSSISSMAESSMAAGRLLFSGNGQRIGPDPESPSNNNDLSPSSAAAATAARSQDEAADAIRENTATPSSDVSGTERSTPDDLRTCRRRKKTPLDPSCCPVCGITLRSADLEAHFVQEIERLERVSRASRSSSNALQNNSNSPSPSGSSATNTATSQIHKREQDTRWETFHRIRLNRTNRVRAKARKRRVDERDDHGSPIDNSSAGCSNTTPCPICGEKLYGNAEELNLHVVHCLRRNGEDADEDEPLDVEGDSYEEYEWAGQRRVRASTMLQGGFAGVGMQVCKSGDEETEDVVVDGDDTATFGPSQYGENDILSAAEQSSQDEGRAQSTGEGSTSNDEKPVIESGSKDHVIGALKSRIQELEEVNREVKQKYHCLICLGDYRQPVVSTSCWHVHCEECWLQALGNKKLCPQCNLITSPTHLRRIYM